MKAWMFRCSPGVGAVIALLAAGPAHATDAKATKPVAASLSTCTAPALTQPFLSFGDLSWYAIAPGESYDDLTGSGWTLAGGARIATTKRYDGTTGDVLDLPHGATATSPAMCVSSAYPTARTMVRDVSGSAGVSMSVAYVSSTSTASTSTSTIRGLHAAWSLSPVVNIKPSKVNGWLLARFTFVATGVTGEDQLYNFYVDPRMSS